MDNKFWLVAGTVNQLNGPPKGPDRRASLRSSYSPAAAPSVASRGISAATLSGLSRTAPNRPRPVIFATASRRNGNIIAVPVLVRYSSTLMFSASASRSTRAVNSTWKLYRATGSSMVLIVTVMRPALPSVATATLASTEYLISTGVVGGNDKASGLCSKCA
jgi:hypothetical protein